MESPDPQIAFAAKEEILRNILKTHSIVLIEGWQGTGKTVTTLKAVSGLGETYYYTEPVNSALQQRVSRYNANIKVLETAAAPGGLADGRHVIIFDDLKQLGREARSAIGDMVRARVEDRKIVIISRVVLDAQDILEHMDAVVRFKMSTAEMLHTKLHDKGF